MSIENVNNSTVKNAPYKSPTTQKLENAIDIQKATGAIKDDPKSDAVKKGDTFVKKDEKPITGAYDRKTVSGLMAESKTQIDQFKKLISSMLAKQGEASNLTLTGLRLNVSAQQAADAKASISEGGEYSVDAVATRIMNMAKALAGGDESKIGVLRNAVEKGFGAAAKSMGGKLADVSDSTYDEVMKRFDEWENGGKATESDKPYWTTE